MEGLYALGEQFVMIDPKGEGYGLRSSADGRGPGLDVIVFGQPNGDIKLLRQEHAEYIADFVTNSGQSVVLSLLGFDNDTAERRFVAKFFQRLFRNKSRQERRSRLLVVLDEAHLFCMDAETEILTDGGWRRWNEVTVSDMAVAFDLATATYRYERIQRVIFKQHAGELVTFKSDGLDCRVTPDHRVVLQRTQRAAGRYKRYPWTFVPAGAVPHHVSIPCGGSPCGPGISEISDDLLSLLGWVITDGYLTGGKHSLAIEQSTLTEKMGLKMVDVLDSLHKRVGGVSRTCKPGKVRTIVGRPANGGPSVVYYLGAALSKQVRKWTGDDIHRIPRKLLNECSIEQLRVLWESLCRGDGTAPGGYWCSFYAGKNAWLADDFQELCLKLGISATKKFVEQNEQWVVLMAPQRRTHYSRKPGREPYTGLVWDITLPSGAFVARRNGKVFVTGNCPEGSMAGFKGEQAELVGAIQRCVRQGRTYGIGVMLVDQRPADVSKKLISQCELVIAHTLGHNTDRKALENWLSGFGDAEKQATMLDQLASLPPGEAFVWSPSWLKMFERVSVDRRLTFDSGASPDGDESDQPLVRAQIDLPALEASLQKLVEEEQSSDPVKLQARVKQLEQELRDANARPPQVDTASYEQLTQQYEQLKTWTADTQRSLENEVSDLRTKLGRIRRLVSDVDELPVVSPGAHDPPAQPAAPSVVHAVAATPRPVIRSPATDRPTGQAVDACGGKRRLMIVMADFPGCQRRELGIRAGMVHTSGTLGTYISELRTAGYLTDGAGYALSPAGLDALGEYQSQPRGAQLRAYWLGKLGSPDSAKYRMGAAIYAAYPGWASREAIATAAGMAPGSGTVGTYLSEIKKTGTVDSDKKMGYRADDVLFH